MKMMQICALLCLTFGLNQASDRVRRGYEGLDFEFGIGSFSGLEIKPKPNHQLGYSDIGSSKETSKNFMSIGEIGEGLKSLVREKSDIIKELGVSENKSFGLHINTATSIGDKSATVNQKATSIFNNSSHIRAAIQLGFGIGGSVSSSHESAHIENVKTIQNDNKNKLIVLLSSGSIAVSSHNYSSNIEKNSFSASNTRNTGFNTSTSSNGGYKGYTSNSKTENGNNGYNINSGRYEHFDSTHNNRDITGDGAVGNYEQKYLNTAGQTNNFVKSTSLATSASSDIIKSSKIPLQEMPLQYSTSQHDDTNNNRNFDIHTGNVRGVGKFPESGTKDFVTIGSSFNSGFEENVDSNFRNSENYNANKQIGGKNIYPLSSGNDFTKHLDSVFISDKRPEKESRIGQSINYLDINRDYGLRSKSTGTGDNGSHLDVSDTYIHSASGHYPSHWVANKEDKRQFGGIENHGNYREKNGDYRRILDSAQRKGSSEVYNRQNSGSNELHSAQTRGNFGSNIDLKGTDNHGLNWNNRKRYGDNEGRDWERSNYRYGVTASSNNRHHNTYTQSIGDVDTTNNKGNIYKNHRSSGNSYGFHLHNVGSTRNTASNHANNEGHAINWQNNQRHGTNHDDICNDDNHDSDKESLAKGFNIQSNTHDDSYRRHLTSTENDNRKLGVIEGHQVHSPSQINNSENQKSNSGQEKYPTDAIVHGSSSDNIGIFEGLPDSSNKEHTSQSVSNENRENYRAASTSHGHGSLLHKNRESFLSNSNGILSNTNNGQGSYWGGIGVYGIHSSSNEGYKRGWNGYEDQKGYSGGSGRYASQWSDSVGYINQWNITGNNAIHSSGNAAYASHWADSTGQRSHSAGGVGYENHWITKGDQKR